MTPLSHVQINLLVTSSASCGVRVAAAAVGIKRPPTAGMAIQRFEGQLATDKNLRKAVGQVKKWLA